MDKKKAAPTSNQQDESFRLMVAAVRDYAIFMLNTEGIIQTWNEGARRIKGWEAHEIIGKSFTTFYSEEDLKARKPQIELEVAMKEGRVEDEGWRLRKDGTKFWANVVITLLTDKDGKHIGFSKVTRDLTEKRKYEQTLKESEERFRLIVESVRDYAIITLDTEGFVTSWNEGARRLKGYEAEEIAGKHFSVFYEREEVLVGKCEYELREASATGRFEDEGWRVRKDGTKFWANVVVTALRDAQGRLRGYSKVTRDMTERKRNEDKLRMMHDTLEIRVMERTQALEKAIESRDEFLSIASHELRTPLTALKLQQQIFERQLLKDPDKALTFQRAKDMSEMIQRQVYQLAHLVDDMLDVSRISTGRLRLDLKPCSLSDLVKKVYDAFVPQFEKAGIASTLTIEENIEGNCDLYRMDQVISNLLANAIKYGGGSSVEVELKQRNGFAEISVQDRGPGISLEDQARIFKRYERAISANEVSGLGLGLFITEQIMQSHGGHIEVKSNLGQGARFIVILPLKK